MVWTHIEYCAANYAATHKESACQFLNTYRTIADLVETRGNKGVLILNDLPGSTNLLVEEVENYVRTNQLQITVVPFPADITKIKDFPQTDTADLKHPDEMNQILTREVLQRIVNASRQGLELTIWDHRYNYLMSSLPPGLQTTEIGRGYSYTSKEGATAEAKNIKVLIQPVR